MIRTSKHSLKFSNLNKVNELDKFFDLYREVLSQYIALILTEKMPLKTFLSSKALPSLGIADSRYKQVIYKQASEIIRSNLKFTQNKTFKRYKKVYSKCLHAGKHSRFLSKRYSELNINYLKRIKIDLTSLSVTLDNRLFNVEETTGEFNEFVKIFLPWFKSGKKRAATIKLPIKHHKHSNKLKNSGWSRRNSVQLKFISKQYFLNIFWEKEQVSVENPHKLGIDIGYKKLLSDSNGVHYGKELEDIYIKLSRKQRGSKNYKQQLKFKEHKINETINKFIRLNPNTDFICEDLKDVKHKSKLRKSFNNKLQYWSYRQVLDKLRSLSETEGFSVTKVDPSYTSQTCSKCGTINKHNRTR